MRQIVKEFVKFPFYSNMVTVVLVVAGLWFATNMRMSFFPDRTDKNINISVFYPGASPTEMDEGVTSIIEQKLKGVVGIERMNSTSQENSSNIRLRVLDGYDIDELVQDVKNAVDGITNFPSGAERPFVFKQRSSTPVANLNLTGNLPLRELKRYADKIRDDFYNAGITQFNIYGFGETEIAIEVSEQTLNRYQLSFLDIAKAVRETNRDVSGGIIRNRNEEMLIRLRARTTDPKQLENIVVRSSVAGAALRIKDIATIRLQFDETPRESRKNGKRSIFISLRKLSNEDIAERTEFLNQYMEKFNAENNAAQLEITFQFFDMLKARLELLSKNGLTGILLVVLALTLFLSFRLSLWVSFGIPFSLLAMYIIGQWYGLTINMLSLAGMILVIGILVDDGIVIAENIYAHYERGKKPRQAAIDGTLEVLPAVFSSVLTTMVIFGTLHYFLGGDMEFLRHMCFVVVAALGFSLIEAFFILPVHVGHKKVLSQKGDGWFARLRRRLDKGIFFVRDRIYGGFLKNIIQYRLVYAFVPFCLMALTAALIGGGIIKTTIFPSIPFDQIQIEFEMAPGVGKDITQRYLKKIEQDIWAVNNRLTETVLKPRFEKAKKSFWANFSEPEMEKPYISAVYRNLNSSNTGSLYVQFRNIDYDSVSSVMIQEMVARQIGEIPEAEKLIFAGGRWGKPVTIGISGFDYQQMDNASNELKMELRDMVDLTAIEDNNTLGAKEIKIKLKEKAYFLGLDQNFIASQVRNAFYGLQIQKLQKGKDEIRVWVRYPKSDRQRIGQLDAMKIQTPAGFFPLVELVNYTIERGPGVITHREGVREIKVSADLKDPTAPVGPITEKIAQDILPALKAKYPKLEISFRGQQEEGGKRQNDMGMALLIGLILVLVIIMINFKSLFQSLIILAMIPLGWISGIWGHGIENIPVSMFSFWGFIALTGIIINDSIVFLAKYNSLLVEGYKVEEAVYKAGISRFRAIMLTSITTVLGLYPIIWEKSFQAQFLKPMTIALAYGVMYGTIFILIFFPVTILLLNDIAYWIKRTITGNKQLTREQVCTAVQNKHIKIG